MQWLQLGSNRLGCNVCLESVDLTLLTRARKQGEPGETKACQWRDALEGLAKCAMFIFSPMKISRIPTATCRQREMLIREMMGGCKRRCLAPVPAQPSTAKHWPSGVPHPACSQLHSSCWRSGSYSERFRCRAKHLDERPAEENRPMFMAQR